MSDLTKLRIERDEEVKKPSKAGKRILWVLAILLLVGTGFFLYTGPWKPPLAVKVTAVIASYPSQANSVLTASGYVVAQRKAEVASKATGKLESLLVEEGTVVKKGQVIGRLESRDVEAALAQSRADLQVEIATLAEGKSNYLRRKSLLEQKLVSEWDYDVAEAQYKRAIASVDAARARVRAAEVDIENTNIRAPFDGTVLAKSADVGEIVAPFGSAGNSKGAVVSMADMDSLQVEADVSESNLERVSVGQPCEITLDAFPEKRYRGVVHMIVPTADRAKATILTKVRFLDKDDRVLPEMSAKVSFLTQEIPEAQIDAKRRITVDPAAIVNRNNSNVVFLVREQRVIETPVLLGSMIGKSREITQGLTPGDQVVLQPDPELKTGMKVKIQE